MTPYYLKAATREAIEPLLAALPAGTPIDHIGPFQRQTGYDSEGEPIWQLHSGHHVNVLLPDDYEPSPELLALANDPAVPFRVFAGIEG